MNRRELIKQIALLTGAAVAGSEFFLTGCRSNDGALVGSYTEKDIDFLDEVAETIIPRTDTPGAKDAGVGAFMAVYSTDCYDEKELAAVKEGIVRIDQVAMESYGRHFIDLQNEQKNELLTRIDAAAIKHNKENEKNNKQSLPHYFTLMKQMVLLGFFTSKPGATQVLRYVPVPGKYQGCTDYKKGETSWA